LIVSSSTNATVRIADHQSQHQGQQLQARLGGGDALHQLQVERQHRDGPEHADTDQRVDAQAEAERRGLEQAHRDQRVVLHLELHEDERGDTDQADRDQPQDPDREPAPDTALFGHDQDRHDTDDEGQCAPPVDTVVAPDVGDAQDAGGAGEEASDQRTDHR
jgi:hypothetical protein